MGFEMLGSAMLMIWSSLALAGENDAESCLKTKVWDGYAEGWGVRTMTSATVPDGKTKNYLVTLYQGNEYRIRTCGDESFKNLDVLLYDAKGALVLRDSTSDREPELSIKPPATGTYYIVLYAQAMAAAGGEGSAAMAVVYR